MTTALIATAFAINALGLAFVINGITESIVRETWIGIGICAIAGIIFSIAIV